MRLFLHFLPGLLRFCSLVLCLDSFRSVLLSSVKHMSGVMTVSGEAGVRCAAGEAGVRCGVGACCEESLI
jgi:hypothetical protein